MPGEERKEERKEKDASGRRQVVRHEEKNGIPYRTREKQQEEEKRRDWIGRRETRRGPGNRKGVLGRTGGPFTLQLKSPNTPC